MMTDAELDLLEYDIEFCIKVAKHRPYETNISYVLLSNALTAIRELRAEMGRLRKGHEAILLYCNFHSHPDIWKAREISKAALSPESQRKAGSCPG